MKVLENIINGNHITYHESQLLEKFNPSNEELICKFPISDTNTVKFAVEVSENSLLEWSSLTPIARGNFIYEIVQLMKDNRNLLIDFIHLETGKSKKDASGEVDASISQALFFASEGSRFFGKTLTSSIEGKYSYTIRMPLGVVGLIVPANTPLANICWKLFPALICGNTIVLKASEDSPMLSHFFVELIHKSKIPKGVINLLFGDGNTGNEIVKNTKIKLVSFTGSTEVGKMIVQNSISNLKRLSLELGGKNCMIICDDAKIEEAIHWTILSSFSNAGQRCAAASKILIFDKIYDEFVKKLVEKVQKLKIGINDDCDFGPVINKKQKLRILNFVDQAKNEGAINLIENFNVPKKGYFIPPVILENIKIESKINDTEIFGPVIILQKIFSLTEALQIMSQSIYGLTSAIHTTNIDRAIWFANKSKTGVINVNFGTYGSEPHMPFGGFNQSGNGTREPGTEALDVYSELKNISILNRQNYI